MLLWYNRVLLSFICRLFLPFKKEILGYFMVGWGFLPFVSHRSSGGAAFVRKKFIRWLESRFWDQKSIIASEFFLRKLKYGASALTQISTHIVLSFTNFFHQISFTFTLQNKVKWGETRISNISCWDNEKLRELLNFQYSVEIIQWLKWLAVKMNVFIIEWGELKEATSNQD